MIGVGRGARLVALCGVAGIGVLSVASGSAGAAAVRVTPGETLTQIAQQNGTTVAALEAANNLADPNRIVAGSLLQLPNTGGGTGGPTASSAGQVVVRAGQSLSSIAVHYGTTAAALQALNHLSNPNHIVIGMVLLLPAASPSSSGATAPSGTSVIIQPGQTLSSIAAHYGTTIATLAAVNGIVNPNHIVAGMRLRLPDSSNMALASYVAPIAGSLPARLLANPSRVALRPVFVRWAAAEHLSPALLEAMCWWESGWQTYVSSVTGAIGVCQLEPSTVAEMRSQLGMASLNPTVASDNIEMSAAYLHDLLVATGGDAGMALAGYYQGLASVHSAGLFSSTQQYVKGILAYVPSFS
jgi:LysM repeat protein